MKACLVLIEIEDDNEGVELSEKLLRASLFAQEVHWATVEDRGSTELKGVARQEEVLVHAEGPVLRHDV